MKISIIIPIHNRLEVTIEGLRSLYSSLNKYEKQSVLSCDFTILVIDDGSIDGSYEYLSNNFPDIYILKGNGDLWWGGAINFGVKYSMEELKSDFILLWNNDIVPDENYFVNLQKELYNNKIIGSCIYDYTTKKLWSNGGRFNIMTGKRSNIKEKVRKNRYVFNWLTGMGTIIPSDIIKKFGYWDSQNFPQYHCDFDFTLRVAKQGIDVYASPNLVLYNKTEFSSITGHDIKTYINSLYNKGSRYNITKDIKIYKKHCISYIWILYLLKKHVHYFFSVFWSILLRSMRRFS